MNGEVKRPRPRRRMYIGNFNINVKATRSFYSGACFELCTAAQNFANVNTYPACFCENHVICRTNLDDESPGLITC